MFEKHLKAVPPQLLTVNGAIDGIVNIPDTSLFKVNQNAIIVSDTQGPTACIIKRVLSSTSLVVGQPNSPITATPDLSLYLVADNARIFANEQPRVSVSNDALTRAIYEEEPTVAQRVILVDKQGNIFDALNPIPTGISANVSISSLRISSVDNDPASSTTHSSIRVSDGVDDLAVNPDGSINVAVVSATNLPGLNILYTESLSVASGIETTIATVTAPTGGMRISRIDVSGDNITLYRLKIGTSTIGARRSSIGDMNQAFLFQDFNRGLFLNAGTTLTLTAIHSSDSLASFQVTVQST
jgi:hypothetical protein